MAGIDIIGMGPGSPELVLPTAIKKIKEAEIIFSSRRCLETARAIDEKLFEKKLFDLFPLSRITCFLKKGKDVTVLVSGDPSLFSLTKLLVNTAGENEITVTPGISSVSYLYSKLKRPLDKVNIVSLHGRDQRIDQVLKESEDLIFLTDTINNVNKIAGEMVSKKINQQIILAENLSYPDERIRIGNPEDFLTVKQSKLAIVSVLKNEAEYI